MVGRSWSSKHFSAGNAETWQASMEWSHMPACTGWWVGSGQSQMQERRSCCSSSSVCMVTAALLPGSRQQNQAQTPNQGLDGAGARSWGEDMQGRPQQQTAMALIAGSSRMVGKQQKPQTCAHLQGGAATLPGREPAALWQ